MSSKLKSKLCLGLVLAVAASFSAHAANIANSDSEAHTLVITEDGVKNEIVVGVGETVIVCEKGCFLTMPNGDRAALSGGENVEIIGGAATIK